MDEKKKLDFQVEEIIISEIEELEEIICPGDGTASCCG